jgi:3-hydroxybutyryl-CoA dehydrogenase
MNEMGQHQEPVLLVGSNRLTYSIVRCLQKAGQPVILSTTNPEKAREYLNFSADGEDDRTSYNELRIVSDFNFRTEIGVVIALTDEDLSMKRELIGKLESFIRKDVLIAINTESIPLSQIQKDAVNPERILGANWVEPAHTTFFLEIIANTVTKPSFAAYFEEIARVDWGKDPYVIHAETGVRMLLFSAMAREAFYLVKNGYATVEDIDRACRNDAGYYLPFAGNLRYMDLMGTYAYGMVMKDLNPELARDTAAPDFFTTLIQNDQLGMETANGFYKYKPGESEKWEALSRRFGNQVKELIEKYPFNYKTIEAGRDLTELQPENRL